MLREHVRVHVRACCLSTCISACASACSKHVPWREEGALASVDMHMRGNAVKGVHAQGALACEQVRVSFRRMRRLLIARRSTCLAQALKFQAQL